MVRSQTKNRGDRVLFHDCKHSGRETGRFLGLTEQATEAPGELVNSIWGTTPGVDL